MKYFDHIEKQKEKSGGWEITPRQSRREKSKVLNKFKQKVATLGNEYRAINQVLDEDQLYQLYQRFQSNRNYHSYRNFIQQTSSIKDIKKIELKTFLDDFLENSNNLQLKRQVKLKTLLS